MRGVEGAPVPRVQVEAVVGGIHCLLAPAQVHILTEMANSLGRRGELRTIHVHVHVHDHLSTCKSTKLCTCIYHNVQCTCTCSSQVHVHVVV